MGDEDVLTVTSQSDISHSARMSVHIKWQKRWNIVKTDRHIHMYMQ